MREQTTSMFGQTFPDGGALLDQSAKMIAAFGLIGRIEALVKKKP